MLLKGAIAAFPFLNWKACDLLSNQHWAQCTDRTTKASQVWTLQHWEHIRKSQWMAHWWQRETAWYSAGIRDGMWQRHCLEASGGNYSLSNCDILLELKHYYICSKNSGKGPHCENLYLPHHLTLPCLNLLFIFPVPMGTSQAQLKGATVAQVETKLLWTSLFVCQCNALLYQGVQHNKNKNIPKLSLIQTINCHTIPVYTR